MRPRETLPQDEPLLQLARRRIAELNEKYRGVESPANDGRFSCSTGRAAGIPASGSGWAASASAASSSDLNALLRGGGSDPFSRIVGNVARADRRQVRDHAGHRHAAAARVGAAAGRHDGASAEPRALRCRRAGACRRRLRHPAAAHGGEPGGREPLALRPAVRRGSRHRSLHAHGLRHLPGPVRRRLVHRQGHLRRRCVRAGVEGPLSRQQHPQPRSAGRLLRALRAGQRRAALRGISGALQRRRQPAAPLDARRLAAGRLAAAARSRDGGGAEDNPLSACRSGRFSTTCAAAWSPPR